MTKIRWFDFKKFHNKDAGSVKLRVDQLIKYWEEAEKYKFGEQVDVMIYQKVYWLPDWKVMEHLNAIQILDICDPDWLDWAYLKKTVDCMDAVTCSSQPLVEFIKQLTDKPVVHIPDRHDVSRIAPCKTHEGKGKNLVWFGYTHNSESLNQCMHFIENNDYHLTVISNSDPSHGFITGSKEKLKDKYTFVEFNYEKRFEQLAKYDIFLNPAGMRAIDKYKSNNRTTTAMLAGLPVATTVEDVLRLQDPEVRTKEAQKFYDLTKVEYDVRRSVLDYKELIKSLQESKNVT